jgi:hypothetical protein
MRKVEGLPTATAPDLTAMGGNFREMGPPAENRRYRRLPLASTLSRLTAKVVLVRGGDELGTDCAGRAGNRYNGIILHFALRLGKLG